MPHPRGIQADWRMAIKRCQPVDLVFSENSSSSRQHVSFRSLCSQWFRRPTVLASHSLELDLQSKWSMETTRTVSSESPTSICSGRLQKSIWPYSENNNTSVPRIQNHAGSPHYQGSTKGRNPHQMGSLSSPISRLLDQIHGWQQPSQLFTCWKMHHPRCGWNPSRKGRQKGPKDVARTNIYRALKTKRCQFNRGFSITASHSSNQRSWIKHLKRHWKVDFWRVWIPPFAWKGCHHLRSSIIRMHRYMEAQRSGGRRGVKRPRGRGAWMGAGLRAQIEKYNNKGIRPGGHWFVIGEGPLPILQHTYIYIYIYIYMIERIYIYRCILP